MNGSGAGHSKKNILLADLYMFVKFQKKRKQFYKCTISYWLSAFLLVNVYVIENHGYVPFVLVNVYVTDNNGYVPFFLVNVYVIICLST
jgi:oxalate decarboxylase/phosphoglucose isomerase-like protein (cupin superfamily)